MLNLHFGRQICGNLAIAEAREWLVTNGIGGFACGTIAGLLTRRYHGLLVAALKPPLGRTLLLTKLDETVCYNEQVYLLSANRWADGTVSPRGYIYLEEFHLQGTTPVWTFACGDALLEKRIWMQAGENTTYIRYTLLRGSKPFFLNLKAFVNYRDYHSTTHCADWRMQVESVNGGIGVTAFPTAVPFYLYAKPETVNWTIHQTWYQNFDLAVERYRGLDAQEDHLHAASCEVMLQPGESLIIIATTEVKPNLDSEYAWKKHYDNEQQLLKHWYKTVSIPTDNIPDWIEHLVLAADQFIVNRSTSDIADGKTIIAGYPWFGDWGRDTMISLPGLTLATGRFEVARTILRTFARYVDRGMLPNLFPDAGEIPEYNTIDATLWYFEAIRAYFQVTQDKTFLTELYPILADIIDWHRQGTRYQIHLDSDGLLYAGEAGVQLTWMDAKVGDWVVTPRIGKPVEVNALWYNALVIMKDFAEILGKSSVLYEQMAQKTKQGFQRFWNASAGYCYDVLDAPDGDDSSLRPNQIFAVSLPVVEIASLLNISQQRSIVDSVAQNLLTSYGLRSLAPSHPQYRPFYGGNPLERDSAYHQGTTWGWLIGHFVQAHLKVYQNPVLAHGFLAPMVNHLQEACVGNISEIFDANPPIAPRGCFAQAWSVAEVLRTWLLITHSFNGTDNKCTDRMGFHRFE